MRHGLSNRRQRNNRGGGSNNNQGRRPQNARTQVYDSNGPDVRIRGTAHQVTEKYLLLSKDAASMGDRVLAESYLQHAEHYQRIINSWEAENPTRPAFQPPGIPSEAAVSKPIDSSVAEDDLMLPASILGAKPKAEDESASNERTAITA